MKAPQVEEMIRQYLKSVSRALPDSPDSTLLIDELSEHIHEALAEKTAERPDESPLSLLQDVFREIGQPEEIAQEFVQSMTQQTGIMGRRQVLSTALRVVLAVAFILIISWSLYGNYTGGMDFITVVVVLLVLTSFEYMLRSWQSRRSSSD